MDTMDDGDGGETVAATPPEPAEERVRPHLTSKGRFVLAAALVAAVALLVGGVLASENPSVTAQTPTAATPSVIAPASPGAPAGEAPNTTSSEPPPGPSDSTSTVQAPVAPTPQVSLISNVDGLPPTAVAPGDAPITGEQRGMHFTYTVETEVALVDELPALQAAVEAALGDVTQGWSARTGNSFQRIERPEEASIRIVLASPAVVDDMCWRVGLDTAGLYSCWDGRHTMLNSDRWFTATAEFSDLQVYRTYLINHEVGHGIGMDHEYCPAPGELAPLMQQQSISLQGCRPNPWPNPQ